MRHDTVVRFVATRLHRDRDGRALEAGGGAKVERKGRIASAEVLLLDLVVGLARQAPANVLTLQTYLENLRWLAWRWSDHDALPFAEFVELLCLAFVPASAGEDACGNAVDPFLEWDERITEQIQDLAEMRASGTLDAVTESRWHQLDPCAYLERALAGAFSGWQENHDAPKLREITWEDFADFLSAGQGYGPKVSLARDARDRQGAPA